MKIKKIEKWEKYLTIFVGISLLISLVFILLRVTVYNDGIDSTMQSTYSLIIAQCFLGIIALALPSILEKRLKIDVPSYMMIPYVIFLYCAIFLGEVRGYYYNVANWDTYLHTLSGAMLGMLGFTLVSFVNKTDKVPVDLSPAFVAIFAFCFAIAIGVVWEIYEYTFDGVLGLNMQKFMLEDGTPLVGRMALEDTMEDLMVDMLGAFLATLGGYIAMKAEKKWLQSVQIKKEKKNND